ncbi:alpha/beta hydrolase [Actinomadura sp. NTSP31]|uniref:alpha/beta hydrolase n=1 Tax=Actinomadura sp. NTSP31 TaxID=1735447 RepID=UPI0035BFF5A8
MTAFVDGVRQTQGGAGQHRHVTVIGHSYGTRLIGEAATHGNGLRVDDMVAVGSPGMGVDNVKQLHIDQRHFGRLRTRRPRLRQAAVMKRLPTFLVIITLFAVAASGCTHHGKKDELKVADEKELSQGLDDFFYKIIHALDAGKDATPPTGGSAPCDQFDVQYFEDGEFSPYNIASFSSIEDMRPDRSVPAVMRLKAYAERVGWKITKFVPADDPRKGPQLAGHDPVSGYSFSVDALLDARNRIVISVGSKCVRDPRDYRG